MTNLAMYSWQRTGRATEPRERFVPQLSDLQVESSSTSSIKRRLAVVAVSEDEPLL